MKNQLFWFISIFFIVVSGCSSTKFRSQQAELQLTGNPTTGYTWIHIIEDETIISVEESIKYLGAKNVCGAPSQFNYRIQGLKPGKTILKFEYRRPWEQNPPEQVCEYEIMVKENGKILLNRKEK